MVWVDWGGGADAGAAGVGALMGANYDEQLRERLGLQPFPADRLTFQLFDCGHKIGVLCECNGRPHAVRVVFGPGWDDEVVAAFQEVPGFLRSRHCV